eukprot:993076-Prymnesium_polylepis.1
MPVHQARRQAAVAALRRGGMNGREEERAQRRRGVMDVGARPSFRTGHEPWYREGEMESNNAQPRENRGSCAAGTETRRCGHVEDEAWRGRSRAERPDRGDVVERKSVARDDGRAKSRLPDDAGQSRGLVE